MGHSTIEYEIGIKYKRYQNEFLIKYESAKRVLYDITKEFELRRKQEVKRIIDSYRANVDLVISTSDFFYPAQVTALKNHFKCPIIMWYPDAIVNLKKSLFVFSDYNAVFFKEPFFVDILQREYNCKNVFYLPECFNPIVHKILDKIPLNSENYFSDITTAGNLHPYRVKFFNELKGYNIKIWGNPAPGWIDSKLIDKYFQNRYIANEEKAFVFHNSKIVINNLHPGEIWGINVRAFEIAGCGGFQLINWRPSLRQLFNENDEITSFKNFDELKEKIDYYLLHESERKRIATNAYNRVQMEHTYEKRLGLLLQTLNRQSTGFPLPDIKYK